MVDRVGGQFLRDLFSVFSLIGSKRFNNKGCGGSQIIGRVAPSTRAASVTTKVTHSKLLKLKLSGEIYGCLSKLLINNENSKYTILFMIDLNG